MILASRSMKRKKAEHEEQFQKASEKMEAEQLILKEKVDFFEKLQQNCTDRASEYSRIFEEKNTMVEGINAAVTALENETSQPAAADAFLQISSRSRQHSLSNANLERSAGTIARMMVKHMSKKAAKALAPAVAALAQQGMMSQYGLNALKEAVENAISELKAKWTENDEKKKTCISETQRLSMEVKGAQAEEQSAEAQENKTRAAKEAEERESETQQRYLSENEQTLSEKKADCAATETMLNAQITEVSADITGLTKAENILAETFDIKNYGKKENLGNKSEVEYSSGEKADKAHNYSGQDMQAKSKQGMQILSVLQAVKTKAEQQKADLDTELTKTGASCEEQIDSLTDSVNELKEITASLETSVAELGATLTADETTHEEKTTAKEGALKELSDYGPCATNIKKYNNILKTIETEIYDMKSALNLLNSVQTESTEVAAADTTALGDANTADATLQAAA